MKHSLLPRFVCPITGDALRLHSFETEVIEADGERVSVTREGLLLSDRAGVWYPIHNYVPVLLVFRTGFHDWFYAANRAKFEGCADYRMPDGTCEPGERAVQTAFTEEWNLTQEDPLSFVRTHDDLVNLNRHVWLQWIRPGQCFERTLNIGCGIGKETMALREVVKAREIFAVDLNFALLQAGPRYRDVGDVQFVICSLFHLPFARESFDLVYTQGVIHHTWSTREAFRSVASFVREGGYLFAWVYALDDHLFFRNTATRSWRDALKHAGHVSVYHLERLIRPWLSRSPSLVRSSVVFLLAAVMHPFVRQAVLHKDRWTMTNTRHSVRDLFTPLYAFRHNTNEVVEWYEDLDFRIVGVQSASAHKRYFSGKRIHGIGLTGQRVSPAGAGAAAPDRARADQVAAV